MRYMNERMFSCLLRRSDGSKDADAMPLCSHVIAPRAPIPPKISRPGGLGEEVVLGP